jgi:hypothetical protein
LEIIAIWVTAGFGNAFCPLQHRSALLIGQRLPHAAESIKGRAFIGFDLDAKV